MNIIDSQLEEIKRFINPPKEAAFVKSAGDVVDQVVSEIHDPAIAYAGVPIHYLDYEDKLRFRPGELSIWSGHSNCGKSQILNQFILHCAHCEVRSLIISPEMPLRKTMKRMTYQATRQRHPHENEIRQFHTWVNDRIWLYDQHGTIDPKIILAVIRYAVATFKIEHVVIDSLMKCGLSESKDFDGVKSFVDELTTLAKDLNIHVHLVAHSRKNSSDTSGDPDQSSIAGTAAIGNLADNVLIQTRNFEKEKALGDPSTGAPDRQKYQKLSDAKLIVRKQRDGDWTGSIRLWLDMPSLLFMDSPNTKPIKTNYSSQKHTTRENNKLCKA